MKSGSLIVLNNVPKERCDYTVGENILLHGSQWEKMQLCKFRGLAKPGSPVFEKIPLTDEIRTIELDMIVVGSDIVILELP